jgi:hypothetical protein
MKLCFRVILTVLFICSFHFISYAVPNISSPEDISLPPCTAVCGCDLNGNPLPSGPCGCDLTITKGCDNVCGSGKVLSGCDNQCDSNKVVGCDGVCDSGKVLSGCDNQCGSTKVDLGCGCGNPSPGSCGCGGTPDACGNCGTGPFPPSNTPNKCGGCGEPNLNECGFCPDDPNRQVNLGCECGNPGPSGCDNKCGSTNVAGCDGVCNSGKVLSGCDNQCGSTLVADACGTCGGNGTSCADCLFVAGWSDYSGYLGTGAGSLGQTDIISKLNITRSEPLPSCFKNKLKNNCSCGEGATRPLTSNVPSCAAVVQGITQDASVKIWGGCTFAGNLLANVLTQCFLGSSSPTACQEYIKSETRREQAAVAAALGVPVSMQGQFAVPALSSSGVDAPYWYFDKNCNSVNPPANAKVCGYAGVSWSPISLILDNEVSINEDMQVVEFNLTGNKKTEFVIWKASKDAPLLVYDPENKGKVTGTKQLFGNFTYGGKTLNLKDYYSEGTREPWKNGYEALAILDKDNSGDLLGGELDDLALWFDENRNAISEEGEVKALREVGITKLFYKEAQKVVNSNDLKLEVGFERETAAGIISGSSIDWFTEIFPSKSEALSSLSGIFKSSVARGMIGEEFGSVEISDSSVSSHANSPKGIDLDYRNNLTGYWVWTILEKGSSNNPGVFVLTEDSKDKLYGYTISSVFLDDNKNEIKSAMVAVPGAGEVDRSDMSNIAISMNFKDLDAGGESISKAKLSSDGTVLEGSSEQIYKIKIGDEVKSTTISYKWIATKVGVIDIEKVKKTTSPRRK